MENLEIRETWQNEVWDYVYYGKYKVSEETLDYLRVNKNCWKELQDMQQKAWHFRAFDKLVYARFLMLRHHLQTKDDVVDEEIVDALWDYTNCPYTKEEIRSRTKECSEFYKNNIKDV